MNENWRSLTRLVPENPDEAIRWGQINETVFSGYAAELPRTQQDPEYHGEGDAWTHTKLVCENLVRLDAFRRLDETRRTELFIAALLHDVGKTKTTTLRDGRPVSPHHGQVGMQIARQMLWVDCDLAGKAEAQRIRETICLLIRYHTAPVNALKPENPALFVRKLAANGTLAPDFTLHMLCLLAEADELGRIANDTAERCELVRLCAEQADEANCLYHPYPFPDEHTAYGYLSGRNVLPDVPLYDDTWGEVVMLCGLPGTGKDRWICRNLPGLPMLSLDNIRRKWVSVQQKIRARLFRKHKRRRRSCWRRINRLFSMRQISRK